MVNTNMVGVFPSTASLKEVSIRNRHNGLGRPIKECSPRLIGAYGVDLAAAYLEDRGYNVVDRHWVSGCGTVDLVCVKGDTAVLVEVRSRTARSGHKVYIEDMKVGYRRRHMRIVLRGTHLREGRSGTAHRCPAPPLSFNRQRERKNKTEHSYGFTRNTQQ